MRRSRTDVGPFARGSIIVLPAAALFWARAASIADPALIALIYAAVAILSTILAVLSRRRRYVQAAILAAMRAVGRSLLIHR